MLFNHRYSHPHFFDGFVEVLSTVDELLLLDVYSAGESPIAGADTKALARSIRLRGTVEPTIIDKDNIAPVMKRMLKRMICSSTRCWKYRSDCYRFGGQWVIS